MLLESLKNRLGTFFGYDAIVDKNKRRMSAVKTGAEDKELGQSGRGQLNANARDQVRNFAVAAWAVRKHLDFVSRFRFDCKSGGQGDDELTRFDKQVEALMTVASYKENWDIAGRHDRNRWLRLFEARACVDGDVLGVKMRTGHLQAIESDRIRNEKQIDTENVTQGVEHSPSGRAVAYQVHRRDFNGGFKFERRVPAENCVHHGYFDRFDQVRGISPMAPGLNTLQDTYENFDYALMKAKISQLFGIKFTREAEESPAPVIIDEDEDEGPDGPRYSVTFGNKPIVLDLNPGDDAEFLESNTPSEEFQAFTSAMIQVALKALDIPYCFFDESHTNFYGSRAAVTLYVEACKHKREALEGVLRDITLWKLRQWVFDGKLVLPAGMTVETVPFCWIHAGLPWWDPAKEISAEIAAVKGGLTSRSQIRKEKYGDDWKTAVIDVLADEQQYAESKGVVLETAEPVLDPNEEAQKTEIPAQTRATARRKPSRRPTTQARRKAAA